MLCSEIGPAALGLYMNLIVVIFLIAGRGKHDVWLDITA